MKTLITKRNAFLAIFLSLVLVVAFGCGGGGGGDSTGDTDSGGGSGGSTADSSPSAARTVSILNNALSFAGDLNDFASEAGGTSASSLSLMSGLSGERTVMSLNAMVPVPCPLGGTMEVSGGTAITAVYDGCKMPDGEKTMVLDGKLTISLSGTDTIDWTYDNFSYQERRASDNALLEQGAFNGTGAATINGYKTCSGDQVPSSITVVMNGTSSVTVDKDGDGTLNADYDGTYTDFNIVSDNFIYDSNCELTGMTISFSGDFQYVDNLNSDTYDVAISYSTPIVVVATGPPDGNTSVTMNGSLIVTSSCLNGTITIETITPLIYPVDEDCPASGEIKFTGAVQSTVVFTGTGFTVDEGSDGTIDETYADCTTAFSRTCSE